MTQNHSWMPLQPITVLPGFQPPPPLDHHNNNNNCNIINNSNCNSDPRRTPSPAETSATISESFSTTASNNAMNMMIIATTTTNTNTTTTTTMEDDSPVPGGLDASSHSSPGSASDHMGVIPNTVTSNHHPSHPQHANYNNNASGGGGGAVPNQHSFVQPLFPGSSVLAAFDAGHPNLYGHSHPQQQQPVPPPPSIPTSNMGVTVKSPVLARRKGTGTAGGTATAAATKNQPGSTATAPPGNRRQSRLQRNRESARLSRKRRKQYLELLEERVDQLSETLDGARRQHVANAVTTFNQKRIEYILLLQQQQQQQQQEQHCHASNVTLEAARAAVWTLENHLSRTNEELMIATTFSYQQLKSFSIPPSMQFTLWLTLQTDTYFRGGRTASERLSAARIGERVRAVVVVVLIELIGVYVN